MQKYRFEDIIVNSTEKRTAIPGDEKTFITPDDIIPYQLQIHSWGINIEIDGVRPVMHKGDVLFLRSSPYTHQVAVAPFDGLCTSYCAVYRAKPDIILPDFLPYLITSNTFFNTVHSLVVGSTKNTINWGDLKEATFTIPDLETQKKYLPIISETENLIEKYEQLHNDLQSAEETYYYEFIRNNPERKSYSLGELMYPDNKHFKLGSYSMENYISYEEIVQGKTTHSVPDKLTYASTIHAGQIIAHRQGFCKGSVCLITPEYDNAIISNAIQVFSISSAVLPEYLCYILCQPSFISKLGNADLSNKNWNNIFSKICIEIPPIADQKKFLSFLEKTKASLSHAKKCKEQAYETFQTILCSIITT